MLPRILDRLHKVLLPNLLFLRLLARPRKVLQRRVEAREVVVDFVALEEGREGAEGAEEGEIFAGVLRRKRSGRGLQ